MKITHKIPLYALSIALVFIATSTLNITIGTSLTNLGDAFIFICSALFGPFTGFLAGAFGSSLADFALGWGHTAIYTFIIKGLEGLVMGLLCNYIRKKEYKLSYNFLLIIYGIISGLIMILGYFLAESFMYGTMEAALAYIYTNVIQATLSIVVFLAVYNILIKVKMIKNISKEF